MRSLHELYKLVLIEFETNNHPGICAVIVDLKWFSKITINEYQFLLRHFMSEKPKLFKNTLFVFNSKYKTDNAYWWPCGDKKPRIKFIKHLINKTK